MFESIEIRKVANGYVVTLNTEEGTDEYIFPTIGKMLRFVKGYVEGKPVTK